MNICFFTAEIPNLRSGGIENVTYRLAKGFGDRGHNVFCISLENGECTDLPFMHFCINRNGNQSNSVKEILTSNNIEFVINQGVEEQWRQIVANIKPKLPNVKFIKVLHTDPYYLIKGVRDQEPLYTEAGSFTRLLYRINPTTFVRRKRRLKYSKALYRDWLAQYDQVVLLSGQFIEEFYSIAGIENNGLVSAIGNPVELRETDIQEKKENIVLFVGRLHSQAKRPDRLLKIWHKFSNSYKNWQLIFVGDGPLRNSLERYVKKTQMMNVSFVGQTNPQPFYKKASILCVTSTYEGFSLVCAEALANNVVPIVFDSFGAVKDLVNDEINGILIQSYDLNEYANKLKSLMSDNHKILTLRHNIASDNEFREKFSLDVIISQWESLFNKIK